MKLDVFEALPDHARLWIYGFETSLEPKDQSLVRDRLAVFMKDWHSHNADVTGAFEILLDRFVILSGASHNGLSGCSIDSSVQNFKLFRDEYGLNALNRSLVHYRSGDGAVAALDRTAFRAEVDAGRCGVDTLVFDLTIQTLGDLRAGRLEVPLADAWHAKLFLQ